MKVSIQYMKIHKMVLWCLFVGIMNNIKGEVIYGKRWIKREI
ncbi:hypothetical protein CoNPh11_CDS0202 [Staphylococcus phage S-CoN_Ph11]|nr:hypothetical protein CoNPh11_CDS0202 [Staphylococcus phage S-CoN_Ph11]WNM55849.1 hypothetical protein CoNPh37_CDS0183 [Staphylococcus phage S-CoN_Ph37]